MEKENDQLLEKIRSKELDIGKLNDKVDIVGKEMR